MYHEKQITAFVTNHGHMDIEWYQTLDQYRYWFVASLAHLLDIVNKDHTEQPYILDGAVYPLEAALQANPALKEPLTELIRKKLLRIGPFYTQFDEFLNNGENIIMNCLWGTRIANSYGNCMYAGYLPDNFGHPSQLPQIFRGFDIDTLFFTRGMVNTPGHVKEFLFEGDDGSTLYTANFQYSGTFSIYSNNNPSPGFPHTVPGYEPVWLDGASLFDIAEHIDHASIAEQLINNVRNAAGAYPSGVVPVFTGCDHCPPQKNILKTLQLANEMQNDIHFIFGDAQQYGELLKNRMMEQTPCRIKGDLIGTQNDYLLLGAMTARTYLKQLNDICERVLFEYAYPLKLCASVWGTKMPGEMLTDATQKLLLNSTHDSIHGSSIDSVHMENEYRYHSAIQNGTVYAHHALDSIGMHMIAPSPDMNGSFLVYMPCAAEGIVCHAYVLSGEKSITLYDCDNNIIPCDIFPPKPIEKNAKGEPYTVPAFHEDLREICFIHKRPETLSLYSYKIEEDASPACASSADNYVIENEFLRIEADTNTFTMTDRSTGFVWHDIGSLLELADAGDVWDSSMPWTETAVYTEKDFPTAKVTVSKDTVCSIMELSYEMLLPKNLVEDVRSGTLVSVPVTLRVSLYSGIRRADVQLIIENHVDDHDFRLVFPQCSESSIECGGLFTAKHMDPGQYFDQPGWITPSTRELPFRDWVAFHDRERMAGLAVAVRGLYTYEFKEDHIEIPVMRCVGTMTKSNMRGRTPGGFGGNWAIPDAQCHRKMEVNFSVLPMHREEDIETVYSMIEGFLRQPIAHSMRKKPNGTLPPKLSPYQLDTSTNVLFSAYRESMDAQSAILRVYENFGREGMVRIRSDLYHSFAIAKLNETPIQELSCTEDGWFTYCLQPHEILTIRMTANPSISADLVDKDTVL
ncbi:MAG: hypothetical protein IJW77_10760 [Clostridia bacterium]|nr:hypothetical protein [Clostridia bacterium]